MDIIQIRIAMRFVHVFWGLILVFLLWSKGKSKATFHLGLAMLFFTIQGSAVGILELTETNRLFLARSQWVAVLALPALLTFVYYFTDKVKYIKLKILFWYILAIATVILALITDYFVIAISSGHPYKLTLGILDPFARTGFIIVGGIMGFYYLFRGYLESQGLKRQQLKYFLVIAAVFVVEKIITLGILPLYSRENIYFFDIADDIIAFFPAFLFVYIVLSKKMVFEMKVILTEILVGVTALILFVQAFLFQGVASKILGFVIFIFFLFAGYLLIKTTRKEIQRKEEVEKLAKELEGFNQTLEGKIKERTKDLEKSYQEIKTKQEELENFYNLAVERELKMVELKKEIGGFNRPTNNKKKI